MARATSRCNASTSRRSRSYVSAHTWRSVAPSISCAVILSRPPACSTYPSTTKPTFSSLAISGSGLLTALYCITDLREITLSAPILDRSAMRASVMPSTKYSCPGSPVKLSSGSTASDSTRVESLAVRSEEHTSELQSLRHLVCRLLLEKKKKKNNKKNEIYIIKKKS